MVLIGPRNILLEGLSGLIENVHVFGYTVHVPGVLIPVVSNHIVSIARSVSAAGGSVAVLIHQFIDLKLGLCAELPRYTVVIRNWETACIVIRVNYRLCCGILDHTLSVNVVEFLHESIHQPYQDITRVISDGTY